MKDSKDAAARGASCPACTGKTKQRTEAEKKDLITRLNRIEGQIRGIRGMIENEAYCVDVLNQTAAVRKALDAFSRTLLGCHIRSCVVDGIRNGDNSVVDELVDLTKRLL